MGIYYTAPMLGPVRSWVVRFYADFQQHPLVIRSYPRRRASFRPWLAIDLLVLRHSQRNMLTRVLGIFQGYL